MSISLPHFQAPEPPSFVVGRDARGNWLAVETHGLGGGLFVTRDAALHYARDETGRRPGAVTLVDGAVPQLMSLRTPPSTSISFEPVMAAAATLEPR